MKRTLLWLLALILFGACQKHESVGLKQDDLQPNNEYCVSEEDAVARALTAIAQVEGETASRADVTRRLKQIQRVRGSALTRSAEDIAELFYLVNFADDQGYALVAADERMTDVYMMSETGNLDLDKVDPQSGLSYFLNRAVDFAHGELIDSLPTLPGFGNGDEMFDPNDSISRIIPEEYNGRWYHVYRQYENAVYEALLPTKWHQQAPYNNECPYYVNYPIRSLAGCVAIAMGQIMAYHRYPTTANGHTYNWDAILVSNTVSVTDNVAAASVATLIHDAGLSVNMQYGTNYYSPIKYDFSSAYSEDVPNGFSQFGYATGSYINYSYNSVYYSIIQNRPVYSRGVDAVEGGHAWVIDGCKHDDLVAYYYSVGDVEFCFKQVEGQRNQYVHCNWGWGTDSQWALSGVFNATSDCNFELEPKIIPQIRPN